MAKDIVTDTLSRTDPNASAPAAVLKYTPERHAESSDLKVVRLIELGGDKDGKSATFEFIGGFIRSIDIDAQNVWHPIFDEVKGIDWRRLLGHVAPRFKCPDGTAVIQNGPMWFWTSRTTPRGRRLDSNYFDVPREEFTAGTVTGSRAARDLILFLKRYGDSRATRAGSSLNCDIQSCIRQAFALAAAYRHHRGASAAGAASAFCDLITTFFVAGTHNANPSYLDQKVTNAEETNTFWLKYREETRLETLERMRALRAAKESKKTTDTKSKVQVGRGAMLSELMKTHEGATGDGHMLQ